MDANTVADLAKLIPKLRELKVSHLKVKGFEVSFHAESTPAAALHTAHPQEEAKPQDGPEKSIETVRVDDVVVPQGLTEEMNYDKILNWSAPVDEGNVPLTGDIPLPEHSPLPTEGSVNG